MKGTTIFIALVVGMLLASAVLAANGLGIPRDLIGGGGGSSENGNFALQGSIGQAVAGWVGSTPYELGSGFWPGARLHYHVYLPLALRNTS